MAGCGKKCAAALRRRAAPDIHDEGYAPTEKTGNREARIIRISRKIAETLKCADVRKSFHKSAQVTLHKVVPTVAFPGLPSRVMIPANERPKSLT
jgi:hypothetical protein